jgi:hypothetical protein
MDVAMMQPAFMPWLGLFELILKSDIFIFLDDFQFSVQSYHQRNRLFFDRGRAGWYTAPVKKADSFKLPLNRTKINESIPWRRKMWKSINMNYSKAPYFKKIAPAVEKWLMKANESLSEQNIELIMLVCNELGITTEFRHSSDHYSQSKASHRVLDLLQWSKADRYYCAKGSFPYMREEGIFPVEEIEVLFQDFKPKPYYQVGSPDHFITYLSVLDALMNVGPEHSLELIKNGTEKWLSWNDMAEIFSPGSISAREKSLEN